MKNCDPLKFVGVIAARGGSKRLPRKNILPLCGKPLIAWSIEAARGCAEIDRLIVTTDDEEIADISRQWGAEVPFLRPSELATDMISDTDAFLHALQWLRENESYHPDFLVCIPPTSPLRTSLDIQNCLDGLRSSGALESASFCKMRENPLTAWNIFEDQASPCQPEIFTGSMRSQDLPPAYRLNGAVYIISVDLLRRTGKFLNPGLHAYIMPFERSFDIDTELDFLMAEAIMRNHLRFRGE